MRGGVGLPPETAEAEAAALRPLFGTFRALGYRNFRYLWAGQITNSASI